MIRDHQRFSNIAAGIQSVVIALSIITGGIWAIYHFNVTLQLENARASLDKMQRELEEQASLEIAVEAEQLNNYNQENLYISGFITIKNNGTRNTVMDISEGPISYAKVDFGNNGEIIFRTKRQTKIFGGIGKAAMTKVVLAKNTDHLPFLINVEEPGIYMIAFSAERTMPESFKAMKAGANSLRKKVWYGGTFVTVKGNIKS